MFKIEMLPAGYGDSIIVEYGRGNDRNRILIDAGPYFAFDELAKRFKVLVEERISLELFVVTHVDCDHIDGAITILNEDQSKLKMEQIWFNSYNHLSDELGAPEGDILSALIGEKNMPWNTAFGGKAVALVTSDELKEITLRGGLHLTLLSPTRAELERLKPDWEKAARKAGIEPGSREDALELLKKRNERYRTPPDLLGDNIPNVEALLQEPYLPRITSTNQSSIAFLAEYDGKSCLFTGDASPIVMSASIRTLLKKRKITTLKLDAVKVSHHGSKENTSPEMMEMLKCKRFLISTNGKVFNHPHQEAIARIIELNGPDTELIFNYKSPQNKVWETSTCKTSTIIKSNFQKIMTMVSSFHCDHTCKSKV
jgi:beta-lactamase superfamily II metal-dependent hydrolase